MYKLMTRRAVLTVLTAVILVSPAQAGRNDPVTGENLDYWINQQHPALQAKLMALLPESDGYFVTGPQNDPAMSDDTAKIEAPLRILSTGIAPLADIIETIRADSTLEIDIDNGHNGTWERPLVDRLSTGKVITFTVTHRSGEKAFVRFSAWQQMRLCLWLAARPTPLPSKMEWYARELSDHLWEVNRGKLDADPPGVSEYNLADSVGFYAEPPDYVIEGYDNYMNFLHGHTAIYTEFARGVTAFTPSDSLLEAFKANAPDEAYPNKEWPMLQREFRKFFERGGDPAVMQTLTRGGFDTLQAGEYFFAVGLTGKIRFGRELLRSEVQRLEEETGRKVPRANHAFLFPGELVLTAGAFFVEDGETGPRLRRVTAQSGHYFYSNLQETIREDIAVRSNRYLLTLGHLFVSLDSLGIPYHDVLISKF